MAKEVLFAVDNFNTPKQVEGIDANAQLLYYTLMGRNDSRLTEGLLYAIKRFQFKEIKEATNTIENTLRNYCNMHIPDLYINSLLVNAKTETHILLAIDLVDTHMRDRRTIIFSIEDKETKLLVELLK